MLGVLVTAWLPAAPAQACTPPPDGHVESSATERTRAAEIVLLGEIAAVYDGEGGMPGESADVRVEQYLKGDGGPANLVVRDFGSTSICRSPVQVGQRVILFARGQPDSGELAVSYLEAFSGTLPPEGAIVDEVLAAAGQQAVIPEPLPEPDLTATHAVALAATDTAASTADDLIVVASPSHATVTPAPASTAFDTPQLHQQQLRTALGYASVGFACAVVLAAAAIVGALLLRRLLRGRD